MEFIPFSGGNPKTHFRLPKQGVRISALDIPSDLEGNLLVLVSDPAPCIQGYSFFPAFYREAAGLPWSELENGIQTPFDLPPCFIVLER